jgi:hypothetical protein
MNQTARSGAVIDSRENELADSRISNRFTREPTWSVEHRDRLCRTIG